MPFTLIAPFLNGSIASVTIAFVPMSASVFVGVCLRCSFLSAMGRVEKRSAQEMTAKRSSCHLNARGVSETNIITNAPHPNQIEVSPMVQDSMTMQMMVTAIQNHGKLFRMSCEKVAIFKVYTFSEALQ